jgi:hypothetical protein
MTRDGPAPARPKSRAGGDGSEDRSEPRGEIVLGNRGGLDSGPGGLHTLVTD